MMILIWACLTAATVHAETLAPVPPPMQAEELVPPSDAATSSGVAPTRTAPIKANRTKAIDFEDEVIEGLNKNPLDNLQTVGKRDNSGQNRLYRKKPSFKRELRRTTTEMGYTP